MNLVRISMLRKKNKYMEAGFKPKTLPRNDMFSQDNLFNRHVQEKIFNRFFSVLAAYT